jgi:DNA-binding IclR family transcriptional regulator
VFLAFLEPDASGKILEEIELTGVTKNTITSMQGLKQEIESAGKRRYAVSDEEAHPHERAVSVPILNAKGEILAALGIAGTVLTFTRSKMLQSVKTLSKSAERISKALKQ